ncbi:microsomal signal peptidase 12 kDa subunit-domain-containing protein [Pseudomassariella vexata]|uniref:Signal peptidase complex subunit 1 n=1 Tax=Pseudomassariella vexata TaxID=1141098 RepID=A0A1Y2EDI5_9PEZI|nr:microsomal signal peptidase 12 kDa subunit-domain-containing protein [Pseudomassariella vexata]ORY69477.1 microsomal signal peptidase 12 kDa subunit-domain-containing protein [Pseudomassariella vexata]
MAEQLLDQVRDLVDGQIDFEGQKLAEILATVVLALVGVVSFLVGFFLQDIALALKVGLAGTALTFLLVVPPWPFFNRHPEKWLPIGGGTAITTSTHQNVVFDDKAFARQ